MAGSKPIADWRLYWFAQLDRAITQGDRQKTTESIRQLSRLGIEVRFTLPIGGEKAVQHVAS